MKNHSVSRNPILLRNPEDEHYPYSSIIKNFDNDPQWRVYILVGLEPDGMLVMSRKYLAYYDAENKTYDCINRFNIDDTHHNRWKVKNPKKITEKEVYGYWDKLPDENKYFLEVIRIVYFDRILAIDENGDHYFDKPHIFIEWNIKWGPFDSSYYLRLNKSYGRPENVNLNSLKRIKKFPKHVREIS